MSPREGATELDTAGKKALKNSAALSQDEIALTLKADGRAGRAAWSASPRARARTAAPSAG